MIKRSNFIFSILFISILFTPVLLSADNAAGDRMVFVINGISLPLRYVPAGEFMMGSPESEKGHKDEEFLHNVIISEGFWMAETELTQELYESIMGLNPSYFKKPEFPVVNVSWHDTMEFIMVLNQIYDEGEFSLPSEAQWEYACRSGSTTAYCFGNDREKIREYAWLGENTPGTVRLKPVGLKKPNSWGLYDMHGNLWEWCSDWYGEYSVNTVTNPGGPESGTERVCRGGSWFSGRGGVRSADRDHVPPEYENASLGFRIIWVP